MSTDEVVERLRACVNAAPSNGTVTLTWDAANRLLEALSTRQVPTPEMIEAGASALQRWHHERGKLRPSWQEAGEQANAIYTAMSQKAAPAAPSEEALREAIEKVRDGYKSQMKFCDIEALVYFREFVRRIDAALAAPPQAHEGNGE